MTDRRTDTRSNQKYSSEPHKNLRLKNVYLIIQFSSIRVSKYFCEFKEGGSFPLACVKLGNYIFEEESQELILLQRLILKHNEQFE